MSAFLPQAGAAEEKELTDLNQQTDDEPVDRKPVSLDMYILAPEDVDAWVRLVADYCEREHETWVKMSRYDSVRSVVRADAEEMLERIEPQDTKAILKAADAELQAFWDKGGLLSSDAHDHGYLARAILETALESDPDNFTLLFRLTESVAAMTPSIKYRESSEIAPLLDRIKKGVMSGEVAVCEEAMRAMYAWTLVNCTSGKDPADAVPVFQWLVDNAEKGGWSKVGSGLRMPRTIRRLRPTSGHR
jgi:hypothetical protein